eukprot:1717735-Prymnesium_polylepis.1
MRRPKLRIVATTNVAHRHSYSPHAVPALDKSQDSRDSEVRPQCTQNPFISPPIACRCRSSAGAGRGNFAHTTAQRSSRRSVRYLMSQAPARSCPQTRALRAPWAPLPARQPNVYLWPMADVVARGGIGRLR